MLADFQPRGAVSRAYGVYLEREELSGRALFVVDGAGIIRWSETYPMSVNPGGYGITTALESILKEQSKQSA